MPRIMGVDLPDNKKIKYALTYIKGDGQSRAEEIISLLNLDEAMRTQDLTEEQVSEISALIDKINIVVGEVRCRVRDCIQRLNAIGSYAGLRHRKVTPVRVRKT